MPGNFWLSASQHVRKDAAEPQAVFTTHLGSRHLIERGSNLFPAYLREDATIGGLQRWSDGWPPSVVKSENGTARKAPGGMP